MRSKNTPDNTNLEKVLKDQTLQPSTLKPIPTPTLEEVVEKKKPQPITTNPIGNSMEYYWDNTFMVFVEPEVRRQRIISNDPQSSETINTVESTTSLSQF